VWSCHRAASWRYVIKQGFLARQRHISSSCHAGPSSTYYACIASLSHARPECQSHYVNELCLPIVFTQPLCVPLNCRAQIDLSSPSLQCSALLRLDTCVDYGKSGFRVARHE